MHTASQQAWHARAVSVGRSFVVGVVVVVVRRRRRCVLATNKESSFVVVGSYRLLRPSLFVRRCRSVPSFVR